MDSQTPISQQITAGERFAFGNNWASFLNVVDDARIHKAMHSIETLLDGKDFSGKKFLDVGSGSGLMSLAARRLGMDVVSFDCDPASVACTNKLKREYCADDPRWMVYEGSILDKCFLSTLGTFDFVYAWGVLHHTGAMWAALENLFPMVVDKGSVAIALYNDQGAWSKLWAIIKRIYNKLPRYLKPAFVLLVVVPRELKVLAVPLVKGNVAVVAERWSGRNERGMSKWHDMFDWMGGYPFEVSRPEEIFYMFKRNGFLLVKLKTCAGELGCNEYVFEKT